MSRPQSSIARREAVQISSVPAAFLGRQPDVLWMQQALAAPPRSRSVVELAASQKSELYGHFGKFVARVIEATFDEPMSNGVPRLVRYRNNQPREATARDRSTWHDLQATWSDTLWDSMLRIIGPVENVQDRNINTLLGLWAVRMHSMGIQQGFMDGLRGDAQNAATQSIRLALGMNRHAEAGGFTGREKVANISDSTNPIISVSGLELSMLEMFAGGYLGEGYAGHRHTFTIRAGDIRTDIYRTLDNGKIRLLHRVEDFPDETFGTIGAVPAEMPGPRIGCPLLMTQGHAKMFWSGVVNSMAEAGQI